MSSPRPTGAAFPIKRLSRRSASHTHIPQLHRGVASRESWRVSATPICQRFTAFWSQKASVLRTPDLALISHEQQSTAEGGLKWFHPAAIQEDSVTLILSHKMLGGTFLPNLFFLSTAEHTILLIVVHTQGFGILGALPYWGGSTSPLNSGNFHPEFVVDSPTFPV